MVTCRSRVRSTSVDRSVPSSLVWFAVVLPTTALLEGSIRVGFVPVHSSFFAWAGGLDRRIASSRTVERLLVVDFGVCGGGHAGQCHCDGDPRHLARMDARATAADAVGRGGVCGLPFGCHGGSPLPHPRWTGSASPYSIHPNHLISTRGGDADEGPIPRGTRGHHEAHGPPAHGTGNERGG